MSNDTVVCTTDPRYYKADDERKTFKVSISEVSHVLGGIEYLFTQGMDEGWRPRIYPNGNVCLANGIVLYNDPRFQLNRDPALPIEWVYEI